MLLCHLISTPIASFRVVSQSSPPATIRIVVFLNFEYSFYSFFSVFFCTCEGFFFVSGLKSTLWAIMALWAILALWFFWMFFNSFFPHVRGFLGFFYSFFPHVRVKFWHFETFFLSFSRTWGRDIFSLCGNILLMNRDTRSLDYGNET